MHHQIGDGPVEQEGRKMTHTEMTRLIARTLYATEDFDYYNAFKG